jgi:hypothetical protein
MFKSVSEYFQNDYKQYLDEQGIDPNGFWNTVTKRTEVWHVSLKEICCPETRSLNRELGVHTLNYFGNTNYKNV